MDRIGDFLIGDDDSQPNIPYIGGEEPPILTSNFFLDHVGEVFLTLKPDGLSWKLMESLCNDREDSSTCLGIQILSKHDTSINISDVYAVEFIDWGLVHETLLTNPGVLLGHASEMYRFTVHGVERSKGLPSLWAPTVFTFGHLDKQTCQMWVDRLNSYVRLETDRPTNLLVYVNPGSGKGNGCRIWERVAPIFSQAKVKSKVVVTERAGHAFAAMASITNRELNLFDGIVAVGGDGFFNEILNGILLSRHTAPYPPSPPDDDPTVETESDILLHDPTVTILDPTVSNDDESPLLKGSTVTLNEPQAVNVADQDSEMSFPNERFRFGLIPSGSTDAIVICTTGVRDPMTSALQIILGKRVSLDIAQVVRWEKSDSSKNEPHVRYAASFAGYGFYGDVITESEKYRWMGPKRYDYAGTKVFLRHRSYEAKVAYMKTGPQKLNVGANAERIKAFWGLSKESERVACRAKCDICNTTSEAPQTEKPDPKQESNWVRVNGRFLSIGAAVISCRNEKAPDGLVADAHLSDGFLHLVLIKDCPRAFYLWHLTQLARKGGTPLNFDFVEHHKTTTFTFTSSGEESVWNVDGEILQAQKLSAQVFRGLISLFASGPETSDSSKNQIPSSTMSTPTQYYNSLPPVAKTYATICFLTSLGRELNLYSSRILALLYEDVLYYFQIWRLVTNFIFIGSFSFTFAFRLFIILKYGVQLERGPFDKRTADYVWMFFFGAFSLLAISAIPFLRFPFMGASLVFMIVYVWSRELPNTRINFQGLVELKGFYLPWAMLAVDLVLGNPLLPSLLGIGVGHLYYFFTVLYPLAGGTNFCKTPFWVHKLVMHWGRGFQINSPVKQDPSTGVAFQGRSYRVGGPSRDPPNVGAFSGRGRRLAG